MPRRPFTLAVGLSLLALAASVAQAGPILRRERRQRLRIAQGVRSGAVTPEERAALHAEQRKIAHDRHAALRDGHLTRAEAANLVREQNQASRDIWRDKH